MSVIDFNIFRVRFAELIDSSGKTKAEIAKKIEANPPTLVRWFNGTRTPDLKYVVNIADYFGVTIEYLLGLDDNAAKQTLTEDLQNVVRLYSLATPEDRLVINTVLKRYEDKDDNG